MEKNIISCFGVRRIRIALWIATTNVWKTARKKGRKII
jgi:hypothetical protein